MTSMNVQALPLHKPIILKKDCSLRQAALAMKRKQVGSVLVTDGKGELRGLFTDRDLALSLALLNKSSDTLGNVAHHALVYVDETATLEDVVNLMKECGIRRVPVVRESANSKKKCLGIITLDDLIRERLIGAEDEVSIIKSQIQVPKKKLGRRHLQTILHSQGRREHSLATFMKNIESHTGLNKGKAKILTSDVLTFLLHRVGTRTGRNLLSQLPQELRSHLEDEVSSPDHSLTGKLLLEHLQKRLAMKPEEVKAVLKTFWSAVGDSVSAGELGALTRELPRDINRILGVRTTISAEM